MRQRLLVGLAAVSGVDWWNFGSLAWQITWHLTVAGRWNLVVLVLHVEGISMSLSLSLSLG